MFFSSFQQNQEYILYKLLNTLPLSIQYVSLIAGKPYLFILLTKMSN